MSHVQTDVLDVVIIGGGLVGGLTALLLAQGGVQATVLDAAPILDEQKNLSVANPRVLALSQATIHLLKTVDVWDKIARQMPYSGMQVWNKNGYGEINFGHASKQEPHGEQALGSMVEPSLLNLAIQQQMLAVLNDYRTQVKVARVEEGVGLWYIHLADGTVLKTKLVRWCKLFCTGTSVYRYRCAGLQTGWFKLRHSYCTASSTCCTSDFLRNRAFGFFTNGEFKTRASRVLAVYRMDAPR